MQTMSMDERDRDLSMGIVTCNFAFFGQPDRVNTKMTIGTQCAFNLQYAIEDLL